MDKPIANQHELLWLKGVNDKKGKPAGPGPEGYRFEHRLKINAPASIVWDILADVDRWKEWSVLYPEASGNLVTGETINITIFVPGTKKVPATAVVEEATPGKMVMFKSITKLPEKLINGMRYFIIDAIDDTHCIVTDGEVVGGLLGIISARCIPKGVFKGLQLMNEGLKVQAEKQYEK